MKGKRILSLILAVLVGTMVFAGCTAEKETAVSENTEIIEEEAEIIEEVVFEEPIDIAALNGPTGIGMVKLMDNENYNISIYQSPDELTGKIISGEVDLAAVPSNLAAVLYNKTEGAVVGISPITLGVLYIMENGESVTEMADLAGKHIVASGKGGSPEYILNKLLIEAGLDPANDVNIEWLSNHTEVMAKLVAEDGAVALLPEPFVTVSQTKSENIGVSVNLNEEWTNATGEGLPMGVLVAQKSYLEAHSEEFDKFISDYKESVDFVNNDLNESSKLVAEYGFIANEETAASAIPNCNIVIYTDESGNEILKNFYEILFELSPQTVGGKLPDEDFYYQG